MAQSQTGRPAIREDVKDFAAAVHEAWRSSGKDRIAVSRASWLRDAPWFDTAIQVPVVTGRSVWPVLERPGEAFIVVEEPNFFGRTERGGYERADLTIEWWNAGQQAIGPIIKAHRARGRLNDAKRLATALRTVPGVKLPHGVPQAPWFILSLRCSPQLVAQAMADAGWPGATPLGPAFPEFPGGLHLHVAWPQQDNREVEAIVRAAMEDAESR